MSSPLSKAEIQSALHGLEGWEYKDSALIKTFEFHSFREAFSYMVRAAFEAEELNHHPDWTNVYNRVVVRLNTHDANDQVTGKDIELAKRLQKISWVG